MRVVVVGAGVLGASTAYHLARSGAETILVDGAHEGRATAAGAGIVSPWSSRIEDPSSYALLAAGARYYGDLTAALAEDGERELGYAVVGSLVVPEDPAELDAAERRVRDRAVHAPEAGEVERLSPADARSLFPPLHPDLAAVHVSGGARVDGRLLTAAMHRAAERRGARTIDGSAGLLMRGDRVAGVQVAGEEVEADAVVVAAGAWAPALQPLNGYYLLAFDDSRVVIGATRESGTGFDHRLTAGGIAEVLCAGLATAPGLAAWTLHETRIGFRPLAADNRPMLGPVRGVEGLVVGNGLGASGLTMGPYAGGLLADVALGRPAAMPLDAFDPLRPAAAGAG